MRPNIDIPWSLHGRVKDHAESNDLDLEEAYIALLKDGLENPSPRPGNMEDPGEDYEVRFLEAPESHISELVTFFRGLDHMSEPLIFEAWRSDIHLSEVKKILAQVKQFAAASPKSGNFTVGQQNGAWVGSGIENFARSLSNQEERYEMVPDSFGLDTYKSESALFICDGPRGNSVAVYAAPRTNSDNFRRFGVNIITDGYPVDNRGMLDFMESSGLSLDHGKSWEQETERVPTEDHEGIQIRPVEKIVGEDNWVHGLICENPFYNNESAIERYFGDSFRELAGYKHVVCELQQHHEIDDDEDYRVESIQATDYDRISGGMFSAVNLQFNVTW